MTFKDKVQELIAVALAERQELFLVDFSINDANKISINLDGDQGVSLQDCIDLSRAIENHLSLQLRELRAVECQITCRFGHVLRQCRQLRHTVQNTIRRFEHSVLGLKDGNCITDVGLRRFGPADRGAHFHRHGESAGVVEGRINTGTTREALKASLEVDVAVAEAVGRQRGGCIGVDDY